MKTWFEKLMIRFETISHPAGGWFKTGEPVTRRKSRKAAGKGVLSPESFNVRGGSRKGASLRYTPAP